MVDTNGHTPQINGNRNNRSARRSADSDAAFDQAKKTFLSHFKHFYALVFSAGFLLILTAAAGHLSLWVINESVTEQIWRVTLAAIGLGLLVTGVRVFAIENRPPPPKVIYDLPGEPGPTSLWH
jgi:hypothetical protein